jgi:hypothetical protein
MRARRQALREPGTQGVEGADFIPKTKTALRDVNSLV